MHPLFVFSCIGLAHCGVLSPKTTTKILEVGQMMKAWNQIATADLKQLGPTYADIKKNAVTAVAAKKQFKKDIARAIAVLGIFKYNITEDLLNDEMWSRLETNGKTNIVERVRSAITIEDPEKREQALQLMINELTS